MDDPRAVPITIPDWPGLVGERNRIAAELDAAHEPRYEQGEQRMTVGDLRAALAGLPDEDWIVLRDPRLDRRLWLDHVDPTGHVELVAVYR